MRNAVVMRKLARIDSQFILLRKLFIKNVVVGDLDDIAMLRLNSTEIKSLIALRSVGSDASASDVAKVLGIRRAMASKSLCVLCKVGFVEKRRVGHRVKFRLVAKGGGGSC